MQLTVAEVAIALEKTPRMVRYMIRSGKLEAIKRGRVWMVDRAKLPLDDKQEARAEAKRARVRQVVESALADALPDPPEGKKGRRGRKPSGKGKPPASFTIRGLDHYEIAHGQSIWCGFGPR